MVRLARVTVGGALALAAAMLPWAAHAGWGGTTSTGATPLVSDPSCASDAAGKAVCAALGAGSQVLVNRYGGSSWSGWSSLGVVGTGTPSCTGLGTGKAICAVRTASLQLAAWQWTGSAFTAPVMLGGPFESGPDCALLTTGKAICAGRSTAGGIAAAVYSGASWSSAAWSTLAALGDVTYSAPACTSDAAGHAVCAYKTAASTTTVRQFTGTGWSGAINLGGRAVLPPRCTDTGQAGKVACFAGGTDSALYVDLFKGGSFAASNWSGYAGLGGLVENFGCTQFGQKAAKQQLACAASAIVDDALYTNTFDGSAWSGWVSRGGKYRGAPSCFALNRTTVPGQVMCVTRTQANTASSIKGP